MTTTDGVEAAEPPSVSIVFLVHNRRDELRESLRRMVLESDYDSARVDAIVVDNASVDGSAAMVREEFPDVQVIVRDRNAGVSGWNDGLAVARGDYVLALDDDCYLPSDGLRRAIAAAREHRADLVSFKVASTHDPAYVFTEAHPLGLFAFWGCAVLMRRRVVEALGGYDPEIFVWANELEFMVRFFDRGFRHLYFPDVVAQHMKRPPVRPGSVDWPIYLSNAHNWAYIAAKLLRPRDAAEVIIALMTRRLLDVFAIHPLTVRAIPRTLAGFARGLRRRQPIRNTQVSAFYRSQFETFASPWMLAGPPVQVMRLLPGEMVRRPFRGKRHRLLSGRRAEFYETRARWYPDEPAVLGF